MLRPRILLAPSRAIHPRSPRPRLFSNTPASRSALFNLGGLAASRESQYLSKETGIPRTEYSANIHLIRSSEVEPFAPAPGATKQGNGTQERAANKQKRPVPTEPILKDNKKDKEMQKNRQELALLYKRMHEGLEAPPSSRRWAALEGAAMAIALAVLLFAAYRTWITVERLESLISKLEQEALAGKNSEALPAALPAVIPAETQANAEVSSHQQPSGGVMHWLRSSFWASGGR